MPSGEDLCFCGSLRRHKKCHPGINQDSLAAKMMSLYAAADKTITSFYDKHKKKPVCKKGCGECCGIIFNVSVVEFFLICREMVKWEPKAILMIKDRVIRGMSYLREQHPDFYKFLRSDHSNQNFTAMAGRNYSLSKGIGLECPFLKKTSGSAKVCSVYSVRPLLCRIFGSSFYSYIEDMYICSKIGTNKKIMECGPNTVEIWNSFIQDILTLYYNGEHFRANTYPLIYWLFLALAGLDNIKEYLGGERYEKYFQMPYQEAKEKILLKKPSAIST